jgi:glycosidase
MPLLRTSLACSLVLFGAVAAAAGCSVDAPDGATSFDAERAFCPAQLKRCSHTVTYPDHGERSVEVRGDFGTRSWEAGVPMTKQGGKWTADLAVPFDKPVQYKFVVDGTDWKIDPAQPKTPDGSNNLFAGTTCEPARCDDPGPTPAGVFDWRDSVIYFVFVDRFANGNPSLDARCRVAGVSGDIADYQGGDWAGVTQKINEGYFNQLGVNTLWLTVPFENFDASGKGVGGDSHLYSGSHGYWPKLDSNDPNQLDHESCFGSFEDLTGLVAAAHAKGLKVLFDFAMVHVHSSSAIYRAHPDWFWPNSKPGSSDCICGQSCDWNADGQRCWFTDYLPHWNYTNPEARAWSVANAVAWIKQTGVDGFRADAIKHVDLSWLTELRRKIASDVTATQAVKQRFYMVGETYDFGNRDLLKAFVDPESKLDGQFDFPLRRHVVESTIMRTMNMSDLASFMDSNDFFYGPNAVMSTFIGNHDLPRIVHLAANNRLWDSQYADGKDRAWQNQPATVSEREAYERLANGFAILFTNRGAPLVYYGDEIGLPGAGDPDNRRAMQWAGLSPNQLFLRDRLAKLGKLRNEHPALRRGGRETLGSSADTWVYKRETDAEKLIVAINRSDAPRPATGLPSGTYEDLLSGETVTGPAPTLAPRQSRILVAR